MEIIAGEKCYTAKEITEELDVSSSTFNNAVLRYGLPRVTHDGRWHYPQSSINEYRRIREEKAQAKQTAPLQSESKETEISPFAMQNLDPLEEVEEEPEIIEEASPFHIESFVNKAEPATSEVSPEIAMLSLVLSQLRRKVAKEHAEQFINELKGVRDTVVTLIDVIIEEYQAASD